MNNDYITLAQGYMQLFVITQAVIVFFLAFIAFSNFFGGKR